MPSSFIILFQFFFHHYRSIAGKWSLAVFWGSHVAYWPLTKPSIRDYLHRTHVWKFAEAVTWLKGNVGVMKWYMQMLTWDTRSVSFEAVSACGQKRVVICGERQQVAGRPTEAVAHSGLSVEYPSPNQEAEEVLSRALEITLHGMVKRRSSYWSIRQAVFVSLRPSISLTPQKLWFQERIKRVILLLLSVVVSSYITTILHTNGV